MVKACSGLGLPLFYYYFACQPCHSNPPAIYPADPTPCHALIIQNGGTAPIPQTSALLMLRFDFCACCSLKLFCTLRSSLPTGTKNFKGTEDLAVCHSTRLCRKPCHSTPPAIYPAVLTHSPPCIIIQNGGTAPIPQTSALLMLRFDFCACCSLKLFCTLRSSLPAGTKKL